jgi:Fur family transcriptional regulator, ferric uptake regulator
MSRVESPPPAPAGQKNLHEIGLKATGPRLRILELFQHGTQRHMSAEDVYRQLVSENLEVGLATIYRVLTQFEQAGLLKRSTFETGKAVFELDEGAHHDHLVCLQCGRVEEFFDAEIERRQAKVAKDRGFALREHALALYADCVKPNCQHRT